MSMDLLIKKIKSTGSPVVAGLDAKLEFIPEFIKEKAFKKYDDKLKAAAKAILEFNKALIDELCDVVPAVKPQCAYYEMYGYHGVKTLYKTIQYAKEKGMYVITDGKRNDIGPTMEAYAAGHMGKVDIEGESIAPFNSDSLTVNGYMGSDTVNPLLDVCKKFDRSIFVLVKTSNPASGELQDKFIGEMPVYELMGQMCEKWGEETVGKYGYSAVGAVVGATYPEQLETLREKMPQTFFLVPGYGAQGGAAEDVAKAFDKNGIGAIVNSSRAIMCAYKKENCDEKDFAKAARREAIRMTKDIMGAVNAK